MFDPTHGLFKVPSKEERIAARAGAPLNPFKLLGALSPMQGALFLSGYLAWTMDAWDYFSVSLNVSRLVTAFDKTTTQITTAITLTLLFRSVGAIIFGLLTDRYGRKWPLVANLLIIAVFSLATGFCKTFGAFLAVRCLFGIGMGGIWGMSAATALENAPAASRGLLSGILQQGYAFGYLLAASVNLSPWMKRVDDWRILFWLGAGLSLFSAIFRAVLPESEVFLRARAEERARPVDPNARSKAKAFAHEFKNMLKTKWFLCIYGILLMTGFNFFSHGSQDLYPTMIQKVKLYYLPTAEATLRSTQATIVGNCGAIVGGIMAGYFSQYLGRRLTMCTLIVICGCLIPAWILPDSFSGLAAGAFFVQFCVQGGWGVIPVYLQEISPPAFRGTFAGVAYQLGNMVSAASAQIEARGGESLTIKNPKCTTAADGTITCPKGQDAYIDDYATVSGILLGVVCAYLLIILVFFGMERRGAHFEEAAIAIQHDAGLADAKDLVGLDESQLHAGHHYIDHIGRSEKDVEHVGDAQIAEKSSDSDSK